MLLISGMHQYLLKALAETYILIPVNGAVLDTSTLLASMLEFLANYITIGFRICLPIFAVMLVLNAVLGILAKISPQLNMFAVGMQMKVLVGLLVLLVTVILLPGVADFIFKEMRQMIVSVIEGMY